MRAHVNKDAMAENFTQVLLACPVVCDVAREIKRLPVLDSLVVDLSGDFVPGLPDMSVDIPDILRAINSGSHLERVTVQTLCAEDCVPDTTHVSIRSIPNRYITHTPIAKMTAKKCQRSAPSGSLARRLQVQLPCCSGKCE